jgi:hypothetical protein
VDFPCRLSSRIQRYRKEKKVIAAVDVICNARVHELIQVARLLIMVPPDKNIT